VKPSVVARYSTVGEAQSSRSALDAAGVDVHVADENIVSIYWLYSNAVGGVKLVVRDDDLERAFEVLSTPPREPTADEEVTEPAPVQTEVEVATCPSCGSTALARIPRLKIFAALALVVYGVGVAIGQTGLALTFIVVMVLILALVPSHRCTVCGERSNAAEPLGRESGASVSDIMEKRCPRCGSADFYRVYHHRLKAIPLWPTFLIVVVLPIWLLLPKRRCDQCGFKKYS